MQLLSLLHGLFSSLLLNLGELAMLAWETLCSIARGRVRVWLTLRQIAERRPRDLIELGSVQGMDAQKAERFGPAFLSILQEG